MHVKLHTQLSGNHWKVPYKRGLYVYEGLFLNDEDWSAVINRIESKKKHQCSANL